MTRPLVGLLVAFAAGGSSPSLAAPAPAPEPSSLAPLGDYKAPVLAWAKRYFVAPSSIRSALISEPVPITSGFASLWLVCLEVEAAGQKGTRIGPQRYALGINGPTFFAPLDRGNSQLTRNDCDRPVLRWRPFPEIERLR